MFFFLSTSHSELPSNQNQNEEKGGNSISDVKR
jgi:hypothetical protein